MSAESNLPKDLDNFSKLEMLIRSFRKKLEEARIDPNLGERILASADKAKQWADALHEKLDWFIQYHTKAFEKWRIPEMVSAYKLSTEVAELPTDPNEFFAAFTHIPGGRKRQGGIRKEIVSDLAQMINGPLVERTPSNWIYFTMQLIDLAENHKGVNFGVASEFERFLNDNPLASGEKLSVYELLAYYVLNLLRVLDLERTEQVIDGLRSVANVYSHLIQNSRGFNSGN